MPTAWVSLPAHYTLPDVQAGFNVAVASLSFVASFVFVRYCWQRAAKRVVYGNTIPLHSLLCVNTIGEATDIFVLLNRSLFSRRYANLIAQCFIVIILSATAVVSGPIARFSTRTTSVVAHQAVSGSLASTDNDGSKYGNIDWVNTYNRLDQARFPLNELVDFLPDSGPDWVFSPTDWNNSWSMDCGYTQTTPLQISAAELCTTSFFELPELQEVFDSNRWQRNKSDVDGYMSGITMKDSLVFVYGTEWIDADTRDEIRSINMTLASIHLHEYCALVSNSHDCECIPGKALDANYTKIDCRLQRKDEVENAGLIANPYAVDDQLQFVPSAFLQYYYAKFYREAASGGPITPVKPEELARFYQVYMIVKDTQLRYPVTRTLSVNVPVVQVSTIALIVMFTVAWFVLLGLSSLGWFAARNRNVMMTTPLSKVDWMMQSIEAKDRILKDRKGRERRSVTVDSIAHLSSMPYPKRQKGEFETARYGSYETLGLFSDKPRSPSPYSRSSSPYLSSPIATADDDEGILSPQRLWSVRGLTSNREDMRDIRYSQLR